MEEMDDNKKDINVYTFNKRNGTAGIGGQLYETKLLSLILFRAIHDDQTADFVLGTNIEGIGALDDIVFRFKTNNAQKSKIVFLQAKHKDDPNNDKLTVEDLFKQTGDFSLQKYLESYLKIKRKFLTDNESLMFRGARKDIECEFIIYTSVKENFSKKTILQYSDEENFIASDIDGTIFQFKYSDQDVERLVKTFTISRIILLAKSMAMIILKDNFTKVMKNDLIKMYHVFLAQNVIVVKKTDASTNENENNDHKTYYTAKFRQSFLISDDENLLIMKRVLCKEIAGVDIITSVHREYEVDSILKPLRFKLPIDFGNNQFRFYGSKEKQLRRLNYLCSVFQNILKNVHSRDSRHIFIKLDYSCVGPNEVIQNKDLENYRLGGLVGNLLINDEETEMLKFNLNEQSLSEDNIKILQRLKDYYDLSKYRIDINIYNYPRLQLNCKRHDHLLVEDFLNKLKFYTNQAKESQIEVLLKKEIKKIATLQRRNDSLIRIKSDSIYLKFHDKVQKWWLQSSSAPYLRKNCQFYQQAEQDIIESPLMNIMNFNCRKKMENISVKFDDVTINCLDLNSFLNNHNKAIIILSDNINFTAKKIIQFFDEMNNKIELFLIDFDWVITENCLEMVKSELESLMTPTVAVIVKGYIDNNDICEHLYNVTKLYKGKLIILTHGSLEKDLKTTFSENIFLNDNQNKFSNLSNETRNIVLEQRTIIFQGVEVTVNEVLDNKSLELFSSNLICRLICNEIIEIGQTLSYNEHSEMTCFHLKRSLCKCIILDVNKHKDTFCFVSDGLNTDIVLQNKNDIVLITESKSTFEDISKRKDSANVHWFIKIDKYPNIIWKQTHGSLETIIKCVDRDANKDFMLSVNTLKDIQERVVILSSEPGMGKSTLLTQLAINTKRLYPNLWILKINLLDYVDEFSQWKDRKTNITFEDVMIFLYKVVGGRDCKYNDIYKKVSKLITVKNPNEIYINDEAEFLLPDIDLTQLKLFNFCYMNNNLAILFDGFDEICPDCCNEVLQLLCNLKASKVAYLWVTSRTYNILDKLELALETFSYCLNPLSAIEQQQFIRNAYSNKQQMVYDEALDNASGKFYSVITAVLNDKEGKFTGLPLHLYMITELYQNFFKNTNFEKKIPDENLKFFKDISNLTVLYGKFTNKKFFDIRFGEKKQSTNFKDPDLRKIIDLEYKTFFNNHKRIASYLLLDKSVVLSEDEIKQVKEFIEIIKSSEEKTGIIEYIIGGNPKFVHFTFAEYFAVELLFDKLRCTNASTAIWEYLILDVLINDKYGIRRFIDSKLKIGQDIIPELQSNKKHMKTVFDLLLAQSNESNWIEAMYVAIKEGLENIVIFLINCIKSVISKGELPDFLKIIKGEGFCVLCGAIRRRRHRVVKSCIEVVTDIDSDVLKDLFYPQANAYHECFPFKLALQYEETAYAVLDSLEHFPELLVEMFTLQHIKSTTAHFLGARGYLLAYCGQYFLKLTKRQLINIFSVKDSTGRLPLHYAADEDEYRFFYEMDGLLGREEFIKMCKTVDDAGLTPICLFSYLKLLHHFLKDILEIVYEESNIDVEDFVFKKLHTLHSINTANCVVPTPESLREARAPVKVGLAYYVYETPDKVPNDFETKSLIIGRAVIKHTIFQESRSKDRYIL